MQPLVLRVWIRLTPPELLNYLADRLHNFVVQIAALWYISCEFSPWPVELLAERSALFLYAGLL